MSAKKGMLGRGRKRCPDCGDVVPARAVVCETCGHQFQKARRRSGEARGTGLDQATIQKLLEFTNTHGGLENTQKLLQDVLAATREIGRLDQIVQWLDVIGEIRKKMQE